MRLKCSQGSGSVGAGTGSHLAIFFSQRLSSHLRRLATPSVGRLRSTASEHSVLAALQRPEHLIPGVCGLRSYFRHGAHSLVRCLLHASNMALMTHLLHGTMQHRAARQVQKACATTQRGKLLA